MSSYIFVHIKNIFVPESRISLVSDLESIVIHNNYTSTDFGLVLPRKRSCITKINNSVFFSYAFKSEANISNLENEYKVLVYELGADKCLDHLLKLTSLFEMYLSELQFIIKELKELQLSCFKDLEVTISSAIANAKHDLNDYFKIQNFIENKSVFEIFYDDSNRLTVFNENELIFQLKELIMNFDYNQSFAQEDLIRFSKIRNDLDIIRKNIL